MEAPMVDLEDWLGAKGPRSSLIWLRMELEGDYQRAKETEKKD